MLRFYFHVFELGLSHLAVFAFGWWVGQRWFKARLFWADGTRVDFKKFRPTERYLAIWREGQEKAKP